MIILIGGEGSHLGQSIYQLMITGAFAGAPPHVDLDTERRNGDVVRTLIRDGLCSTAHDISDGGMLVALGEMALAGRTGFALGPREGASPPHAYYFGEDQGRYLLGVTRADVDVILDAASRAGVSARIIGQAGGDTIGLPGEDAASLSSLRAGHEGWFPQFFGMS